MDLDNDEMFDSQGAWASLPTFRSPVVPGNEDIQQFLPAIALARQRRPTRILQYGENVLDFGGTFWCLEDFTAYQSMGSQGLELWGLLVECQSAEKAALEHWRLSCSLLGEQISPCTGWEGERRRGSQRLRCHRPCERSHRIAATPGASPAESGSALAWPPPQASV